MIEIKAEVVDMKLLHETSMVAEDFRSFALRNFLAKHELQIKFERQQSDYQKLADERLCQLGLMNVKYSQTLQEN